MQSSLLAVGGVECNSFCSSVHLHYATNHLSLYFFLWCITPDNCYLVHGSVDLGSDVASFFQHFSPLVPSSSFPLLAFSCLLFVADFGDISYGEHLAIGAALTFVLRKSFWDWILSNIKKRQKTSSLVDLCFSFFSLCVGIIMIKRGKNPGE